MTCAPRRYSIKSLGYNRFAISKAARPIRRFAARASTSSPPFVRTTLNGQSSANIGLTLLKRNRVPLRPGPSASPNPQRTFGLTLLKRSRGGRPLFYKEEIAGPVELRNHKLELPGGPL